MVTGKYSDPGPGMPVERADLLSPLVAVAIDNDSYKSRNCALKWALHHFGQRGRTVVLVHVNTKGTTDGPCDAAGYKQPGGPLKELFLPYRCFCIRNDVRCRDVVIDDADVARGLVNFIASSAIEIMVLDSPRKGMLRRFMKNSSDVPQLVSRLAPDFCTVYTISRNHKSCNIRRAVRPVPYVSPLHPHASNYPTTSSFRYESSRALGPPRVDKTSDKKDIKTDQISVKKVIDNTSAFYLYPSDNPGMMISSCVLKGEENYDMWVRAMRNALRAKNKLGFIDGTVTRPNIGEPEADLWGICNAMLVSWFFNCIDPVLQPSVAYFETAKELWDYLRERFFVGNAPRIHRLKADIAGAKQQGQSVVTYYTRLKAMWDELGSYSNIPVCKCGGCTCNVSDELFKEREEEKIHQFLMGLDDTIFGTVRTNILSMDPLPNLSKIYSIVVQEERHRSVARGREERSEAVVCTHCGKSGHDVSRRLEIIGYPEGSGCKGHAIANAVQGNSIVSHDNSGSDSHSQIPGLSEAQVQQIMAIVANFSNSNNSGAQSEKLHGPTFQEADWCG